MSCCGGSSQLRLNNAINKGLDDDKKNIGNHVKILLLGAGESGKSTVAKQMKIIHLEGFTEEEKQKWIPIIFKNIIYSMKILIKKSTDFQYAMTEESRQGAARIMNKDDASFGGSEPSIKPEDARVISQLWYDPAIKSTFARSSEFQLNDSAEYFFIAVDRIAAANYVPDEQDVLRARVRTSGIIETNFVLQKFHFSIIDVGGQRSERRKWIHCFQTVTAILFCVAMSGYNQTLIEDETVNRMHESLQLFKDIVNGEWFAGTSIILFLNKRDLFEEKITKVPLTVCFPEYSGDNSYDNASKFIQEQFQRQCFNDKKKIYCHFTCATDTTNIKFVFGAVKTIILDANIIRLGL